MKLLVVSHSCVTPINQQLYADFSKITGWDVDIIVPSNWRNEYGQPLGGERLESFKGRIIQMPVWRPGNIILHAYQGSLVKQISESDPDVVYVNHEPYAIGTAQVYRANTKAIGRQSKPRPIGFYSCQNIKKSYPVPFRWTEAWVYRSSNFACPISPAVRDVLCSKGYTGVADIVSLGVDAVTYNRPPSDHVEQARRRMFGPDLPSQFRDRPLLTFIGRLVPEKGLRTLITALSRPELADCHLALVGTGAEADALRAHAASVGCIDRITFVGFVPHQEVAAYLAAADILMLPSETQPNWKEQFGRVLLEAMACGTPVAGSDSGEIPNLIRDTGGGVVFRERDPADLAAIVGPLAHDPNRRAALACAGASAVADRYDLRVVARRFANLVLNADRNHRAYPN